MPDQLAWYSTRLPASPPTVADVSLAPSAKLGSMRRYETATMQGTGGRILRTCLSRTLPICFMFVSILPPSLPSKYSQAADPRARFSAMSSPRPPLPSATRRPAARAPAGAPASGAVRNRPRARPSGARPPAYGARARPPRPPSSLSGIPTSVSRPSSRTSSKGECCSIPPEAAIRPRLMPACFFTGSPTLSSRLSSRRGRDGSISHAIPSCPRRAGIPQQESPSPPVPPRAARSP